MDGARFDRLTKSLSAPSTRRRLLRLLSAVPVAGGLLFLVEAGATAACKPDSKVSPG